jgi:hypothetical protein
MIRIKPILQFRVVQGKRACDAMTRFEPVGKRTSS